MNSLYVQDNFYPDLNEFPVRTRQLLSRSKLHPDLNLTYKTTNPDLNEFPVRTRPVRTRQLSPQSKWIPCAHKTTFNQI